jgi:hypothetical protein
MKREIEKEYKVKFKRPKIYREDLEVIEEKLKTLNPKSIIFETDKFQYDSLKELIDDYSIKKEFGISSLRITAILKRDEDYLS